MRILVLASAFPSSPDPGQGPFMLGRLDVLRGLGCEFRVVAPIPRAPWPVGLLPAYGRLARLDRQASAIEEYGGYQVSHPRYWKLPGLVDSGTFGSLYYRGVRKLVHAIHREWPFDLIHAFSLIPDGYAAALLGRELEVPAVATERGFINRCPDSGRWRRLYAETIAGLDGITAVSEAVAEKVRKLGAPRQPVRVIYTGIDHDRFAPRPANEARRKLGLPTGKLIACFARLEAIKQPLVVLDAFRQLADRHQDLHLLWVGEGGMQEEFAATAGRLGLGERISLPGKVPHHAVPEWMSAADVVILASESEGLPNSLVEAAACEIPIVATHVGGIPEVVDDGQTGLLVPSNDAGALAGALDRLLHDASLAQFMGKHGRRLVLERFTWQEHGKKMMEAYQCLKHPADR